MADSADIEADEVEARERIAEFEAIRARLGWTQASAAKALEITTRGLQFFLAPPGAASHRPFPKRMLALMRAFDELHRHGLLDDFMSRHDVPKPQGKPRRKRG